MDSVDYKLLYELQDKVLDVVFSTEQVFYLTGGTCLSRFYHEKRYSDDLDFFTHSSRNFHRAIKEIKIALCNEFSVKEEVSSKDFIRLKIDGLLQVDFVNDRVMRYQDTIHLDNGYIVDNWKNILSNKLTAVIGRDNPKDIFDIFLIDSFYNCSYEEILKVAHKKAEFSDDDLIIKLKTFPAELMKNIILVDESFLDGFEKKYKLIIEKIIQAKEEV